MKPIHHLFTHHWRTLLIGLLISSAIFSYLNQSFEKQVLELECGKAYECEGIRAQMFTYKTAFEQIDMDKWGKWRACLLSAPGNKLIHTHSAIFIIDDIWALFFLAFVYLLLNVKSFAFTVTKKWMLLSLLLAYLFDFIENALYFRLPEEGWLLLQLPIIGTIKITLYAIPIMYIVYLGIRSMIQHFKENE